MTSANNGNPRPSIGLHDFADSDPNEGRPEPIPNLDFSERSSQSAEVFDESDSTDDDALDDRSGRPKLLPRASSIARRASFLEDDELPPSEQKPTPPKAQPVTWRSLPKKGQLAILTMARLSEPLTQTSLQAYMFYQLKSFDPTASDSTISSQAGVLQASFTASQFITAILWGRAADSEWGGRKRVLLLGLFGTCLSCVGFGFSRSFAQAALFRTIGGALNGNVGVMRTMIAEIIKEKK